MRALRLFDKISAADLCAEFGVGKSTWPGKSKAVRDALNMMQLDPNGCLPSKLDANPMAWVIMVNGLIVDARRVPREIQEMAYQKGLVPYISEDKAQ